MLLKANEHDQALISLYRLMQGYFIHVNLCGLLFLPYNNWSKGIVRLGVCRALQTVCIGAGHEAEQAVCLGCVVGVRGCSGWTGGSTSGCVPRAPPLAWALEGYFCGNTARENNGIAAPVSLKYWDQKLWSLFGSCACGVTQERCSPV